MYILYGPVNTSLWNWTGNVTGIFLVGPRKSYKECDWPIQDLLYNSAGNISDTQTIQQAEKKVGCVGNTCCSLCGTTNNPYGIPLQIREASFFKTALTCWEIFMINTQTGNANKTNSAHHAMQCSYASMTLFNWQKLLLTGGCLCEPDSSVKMQAW